jgi:hypothetical protein
LAFRHDKTVLLQSKKQKSLTSVFAEVAGALSSAAKALCLMGSGDTNYTRVLFEGGPACGLRGWRGGRP